MTPSETKKYIKDMKTFIKKLTKKKSRELLVSAGIITEKGNLRKPYR